MSRNTNKFLGIIEPHFHLLLATLNSYAYIALPAGAVKLYMDMLSYLRSTNKGNISAAVPARQQLILITTGGHHASP